MPLAASGSSCRDRTGEFHSIIERLKRNNPSFANGGPETSYSRQDASSEFARRGAEIGLGIHQTSHKLEKLTRLAQRTSMFDDPTVEIEELTNVIKQDIEVLNEKLIDLQQFQSQQHDSRNKHNAQHSNVTVQSLKAKLYDTTKDFREVLTQRTKNMKVHDERLKMYSRDGARRFGKQPLNGSTSSELFSQRRRVNSEGSSSGFQQQMQQQQEMVPLQDNFMRSRAEALSNVESTIAELGNIFTQLAEMVSQQGEVVIRIDEDLTTADNNVIDAQSQLLKYYNSISSNRWLMIKIFFVLVIFLVIFLLFIA